LFTFGASSTQDCLSPTSRIGGDAAEACEVAADAAGRPYGGTLEYGSVPTGCVWLSAGGSFYYNKLPNGAGHEGAQPVCAGAPHV
jgi:hypothetical protein